jgi:hypothetical protein
MRLVYKMDIDKSTKRDINKVIGKLKEMAKNIDNSVEKSIWDCVLDLQGKSSRLAPVDTGDLRGSATSSVINLIGEVGFGEEYALEQHENLTFNHPRGGQAKYLENPFVENKEKYKKRIERAIKGELK